MREKRPDTETLEMVLHELKKIKAEIPSVPYDGVVLDLEAPVADSSKRKAAANG